jgi:hypothetical protein
MQGSNVEKHSIDWEVVRCRYQQDSCSIRALAREYKTNDTEIRRRAKSGGWQRYAVISNLQQRVQQRKETERPWDFDTRRDALLAALTHSRTNVRTVEGTFYADALVVNALLYFQHPLDEIRKAVQLDQESFMEIYGRMLTKFVAKRNGEQQARRRR